MIEASSIGYAFAGGIFPALVWLWFWLREDRVHPEPRRLIALAFIAGMITVVVVIPVQKSVAPFLASTTLMFTAWSFIEEIFKFMAARLTVLYRHDNDEPIDAVVYMIAVALGFAAVENALFLLQPLQTGALLQTVLTDNLRFVGATLLHVLASGIVGIFLAFSFYKPARERIAYAFFGVILASLLHSAFNFLILNTPDAYLYRAFAAVWVGVALILFILEFVKRTRRTSIRRLR